MIIQTYTRIVLYYAATLAAEVTFRSSSQAVTRDEVKIHKNTYL